jgi:hypothetical protein
MRGILNGKEEEAENTLEFRRERLNESDNI